MGGSVLGSKGKKHNQSPIEPMYHVPLYILYMNNILCIYIYMFNICEIIVFMWLGFFFLKSKQKKRRNKTWDFGGFGPVSGYYNGPKPWTNFCFPFKEFSSIHSLRCLAMKVSALMFTSGLGQVTDGPAASPPSMPADVSLLFVESSTSSLSGELEREL